MLRTTLAINDVQNISWKEEDLINSEIETTRVALDLYNKVRLKGNENHFT